MDPVNAFVITGSSIQEQTRISAQELASLRGESPTAIVIDKFAQRERARAREVADDPPSAKPMLSERTKERLTEAGIELAKGAALTAFSAWIGSQFR